MHATSNKKHLLAGNGEEERGQAMGINGCVVGVGGEAGIHLEVPCKVGVLFEGDVDDLLKVDP